MKCLPSWQWLPPCRRRPQKERPRIPPEIGHQCPALVATGFHGACQRGSDENGQPNGELNSAIAKRLKPTKARWANGARGQTKVARDSSARWKALTRYVEDGRNAIDNSAANVPCAAPEL